MRVLAVALFVAACGGGKKEASVPPERPVPVREEKTPVAAPEPEEAPATQPMVDVGMPPACREYSVRFLRCIEDDKYPAASRDTARQAIQQVLQGWSFEGMNADDRRRAFETANRACHQAMEAMRQAGESMCPGVWNTPLRQRSYNRVYGRVATCTSFVDKVDLCIETGNYPGEARDAAREVVDTMIDGWERLGDDPKTLEQAAQACQQAEEAMKQSAAEQCPGVF